MNNRNSLLLKFSIRAGVGLSAAALLLSLAGCKPKAAPSAQAAPQVFVSKPLVERVELWDRFSGDLQPVEEVDVRARVSGYLQSVNFTEGQQVKEGDLLFVIDPRPYQAVVDSAKSNVQAAQARVALAKNNLNRAQELYSANAISKEILDTRQSECLSAEAAQLNAEAVLREAQLNLDFTQIRSPISGMASEAFVDRGNLVTADNTLLTTVVRKDILQIHFDISERDMVAYKNSGLFEKVDQKNRKGPPVEVTIPQDPGAVYKGQLTYFDNRLGKETASLTLRADLDNANGHLQAGQNAYVRLLGSVEANAILLPEDIIGTDLVNRYVLVVNDKNIVEYRPVQVGRLLGKFRIIQSGLTPQERVVVVGLQRAIPGRAVAPVDQPIEK